MTARLIGIPGSHAVAAAEAMLRHRGIAYTRRDLPNRIHRLLIRGGTVPLLFLDGERVHTTKAIARRLGFAPAPEEDWADETLQQCVRELAQWAAKHDPQSLWSFAERSQLPFPKPLLKAMLPVLGPVIFATIRVGDCDARRRLSELRLHLDHADDLIARGVIGGPEPNATDFQVAASVRLALLFDDLRPAIEPRPAGQLALRLVPDYPGRFAPVFPADWSAAQEASSPR